MHCISDDIILLSASVVHLNRMLDICHSHGNMLDVKFNPSKSCLFTVGIKTTIRTSWPAYISVTGTFHGLTA